MGQKVHPLGIRLGYTKDWKSNWYSDKHTYADKLIADLNVRSYLSKELKEASLSDIRIDRSADDIKVTLFSARPGVIIGKKGEYADRIKKHIAKIVGAPVQMTIEEVRKPELDAQLVAQSICQQLEKRVMFRRAMKRAVQTSMKNGAKGVKVTISGRLGGAEIARSEWYREGRVPLHTLRADIDYAAYEALTTYGIIGVKVWIFKGEVFPEGSIEHQQAEAAEEKKQSRKPKKGGK